ncbi:hypothetical protein PFISCL1PPCAC_18786, partial [Pristionchus fissidentatus]
DAYSLLSTGRYIVGETMDARFIMGVREQCNLFVLHKGLPDLDVHLLWNKKSIEQLRRINHAIGMSASFINRTTEKYLSFDKLPFTVDKKNCTEQVKLIASQQFLDFPSTAGIFLLVVMGVVAALVFFLIEILAKRRNSPFIDSLLATKVRTTKFV